MIDQALAIPLQPGRPPGMPARGPGNSAVEVQSRSTAKPPALTVPPTLLPPAVTKPVPQDPNRRASLPATPVVATGAPVRAAASATSSVAAR
jgi:hypothetical protein